MARSKVLDPVGLEALITVNRNPHLWARHNYDRPYSSGYLVEIAIAVLKLSLLLAISLSLSLPSVPRASLGIPESGHILKHISI